MYTVDLTSLHFDLDASLSHSMGNMMNEIIFGRSYNREDPMWIKLQRLREEGQNFYNIGLLFNCFKAQLDLIRDNHIITAPQLILP